MPAVPPAVMPDVEPLLYSAVNGSWITHVIGACEYLLTRDHWDGDETKKDYAVRAVEQLLAQLSGDESSMSFLPPGTIYDVYGAEKPGELICNNALYNKADYPKLYDAVSPELRISPTQFRVPPAWPYVAIPSHLTQASQSEQVGFEDSKAVDSNAATDWRSSGNIPQWLELTLDRAVTLTSYSIQSSTSGKYPTAWNFEVKVVGTYYPVHSQSGQSFSGQETKVYQVTNRVSGQAFRWTFTGANGGGQVYIAEMVLVMRQAHHNVIWSGEPS